MAASRELDDICVEDVVVLDGRRGLNEKTVTALVQSMTEIGLKTPITVRLVDMIVDGHDTHNAPVLVTGRHRLEAARRLGWHKIDSWIVPDEDEIDAEIWEIDENLIRSELSPAEQAQHLARRRELRAKCLETGGSSGATCLTDGRASGPQHQKGFAQETADKTGMSKAAINKAIARGNKVVVLDEVKGTSLDKAGELDALAKLSEEEQRELAEKARAGEQVTARKPVPPPPEPRNEIERLNAWKAKAVRLMDAAPGREALNWLAEEAARLGDPPVYDASRGGAPGIPEKFRRDASNRAAWMQGAE